MSRINTDTVLLLLQYPVLCLQIRCNEKRRPDNESDPRPEFKIRSMKKHMLYEKELSAVAKELNLSKFKGDIITHDSFEEFFYVLYEEYISKLDYKNDLLFSSYACNSVINHILDCILENTLNSNTLVHCV